MSQTTHERTAHQNTATRGLLAGPVIPSIVKLALPTVLVLVVQTLVGVAETYFVSFLGTDALAGVTLVFPGADAHADDVEWWNRGWNRRCGGARIGRRPA